MENVIPEIELVITTRCTLKCKACAHLIPYYRVTHGGKHLADTDPDEALKAIWNLLDATEKIKTFRVLGGEPFLHPQMHVFIDQLKKSEKIERLEVVTNATIVPDGNNLECLKGENVYVRISNYGEISVNMEKMINTFENANVKYVIHDCMKNKWGDFGDPSEKTTQVQDLKLTYQMCTSRHIHMIYDGKIYICGRSPHSMKMGFSPKDDFCIDILNGNKDSIQMGLENLKKVEYLKACGYCYGRRCGGNYKEVEPAIQFTNKEIASTYLSTNSCIEKQKGKIWLPHKKPS